MRTKSANIFSFVLIISFMFVLAIALANPAAAQGPTPTPTLPSGWTMRTGVGVQMALPAEMTDIKPTEDDMLAAVTKLADKPKASGLISSTYTSGNYVKNVFFAVDNTCP
ncbi:MAG: hypothetical protein HZB51_15035 [Chloroflexi bacterium]|nr:hypothetical protein [Chloroflexota bacterium]